MLILAVTNLIKKDISNKCVTVCICRLIYLLVLVQNFYNEASL